ncbi:MAG: DNRLRE domain-containing protein [Candidatus Eiseniibacteriota bacterium]
MIRSLLVFAAFFAAAASASADSVDIPADRDNTLYYDPSGSLSNAKGKHMFVGATAGSQVRRALLRFDVAGAVPAGSQIVSAMLRLNCSKVGSTVAHDVSLHRVTAGWGEGTSLAGGEEGQGGAATSGDATWIHRFWNTTSWGTPGGDFAAVASASVTAALTGAYTWGSTAAMIADVQVWLDDPAQNHGWILLGDESGIASTKRYDTRENGSSSNAPVLTVLYLPDPVSVAPSSWGGVKTLFR